MATQPPKEIAATIGNQGPDIWGYVAIGIVVLAAVVYLARQFSPARKKNCCSGCGNAGGCVAADLVKPKGAKPKP